METEQKNGDGAHAAKRTRCLEHGEREACRLSEDFATVDAGGTDVNAADAAAAQTGRTHDAAAGTSGLRAFRA